MIGRTLLRFAFAVAVLILRPLSSYSQFRATALSFSSWASTNSKKYDTLLQVRQDNIYEDPLWLIAGVALDIGTPKLGKEPFGFFFGGKLGVANDGILYSVIYHPATGNFLSDWGAQPPDEYRHDFAILIGRIRNKVPLSWSLAAGLSYTEYSFRGDPVKNSEGFETGTYYHNTGTSIGLAISANYLYLPVENVGVGGLGLYGRLSNEASYVALEFSLIQLNLALPQ